MTYALMVSNLLTVVIFVVAIARVLDKHADERRVLQNRIARPELLVTPERREPAPLKRAEDVMDDFERVGHIGDWGTDAQGLDPH